MTTININELTKAIAESKGKNFIHKCFTVIQNTFQSIQPDNMSSISPAANIKFIAGGVTLTMNAGNIQNREAVLRELLSEMIGKLFLEIELGKFKDILQESLKLGNIEQAKSFTDPYGYTHMLNVGKNVSYAVVDNKGENVYYVSGSGKKEASVIVYNMINQAIQTRFQNHVIDQEVELDEEWCLNNNISYFVGVGPNGLYLQNVTFNQPFSNPYNQFSDGFSSNVVPNADIPNGYNGAQPHYQGNSGTGYGTYQNPNQYQTY